MKHPDPVQVVEEPTDDAFLGGALSILQPKTGYRAGIDAVLLAAATPTASRQDRILDAGAGVGTVGLCIAARIPEARVTLAEIDRGMVALARENIGRNGLAARVDVIAVDLTATAASISAAGLREESFAHIVSNPPFYSEGECRPSKDAARARANAMPPGGLERWIRALSRLASSGGGLTLIHRPEGLPELLPLLHGRFGDLKLLPIHPRFDAPAIRIILQGRKGSRAPLKLLPGLVLHDEGNGFRPEIADILSRGASLPLSSRSSH